MSKKIVNLIYWKCHTGSGNFGDEIGAFIVSRLVNHDKYKLVFNDDSNNIDYHLVAIGSHFLHIDNVYIYGSGLFLHTINIGNNINFCAIRGPLTQKLLETNNIKCDIYGDCALLINMFYTPIIIPSLCDKIGIIPHHSIYHHYKEKKLDETFYLINPTDPWFCVLDQLYSCKTIISASLHGLICADAYSKPNIWLCEYSLDNLDNDDSKIKFHDYLLSQGRSLESIPNIESYDEKLVYSGGNTIDTDKLIKVFPFK